MSFILTNYETMLYFDMRYQFIARITRMILRIGSNFTIGLQSKLQVIELSWVLVAWGQMRRNQVLNRVLIDPQGYRTYQIVSSKVVQTLCRIALTVVSTVPA